MGVHLRGRNGRTAAAVAVLTAAMGLIVAGPANAVQFCNETPIVFTPPSSPTFAIQPLQPYPSTITVSGLTGVITDVNVLLNDIRYTFPEDLDVLLVHPDGTSVLVMSDAGGNEDDTPSPAVDVDLILDQQAPNPLPLDAQLTSGTFRPTDDDDDPGAFFPTDEFPAPAPAIGGSNLDVFNGKAPTAPGGSSS